MLFISDLIIMTALYRIFVLSLKSSGIDVLSLSDKGVPVMLTSASLDRLNASFMILCNEMELE